MRIAHISDLHICSSHKRSNIRNTKLLLDYISKNNFDHVIITGDITDNANQKDFEIIRNLLATYGLLENDKLSLVIGNHDIFGGIQKAEDILKFPSKCRQTDYKEKIKQFRKYFIEAFWDAFHPNKDEIFPFAKDLGDILIIGVNSIDQYSKLRNPFASNGKLSKKEIEGLKKILSTEEYKLKIKILIIHHHFYKELIYKTNTNPTFLERIEKQTMKMKGKKRLIKLLIENDIKLVLHGHLHESCEYIKGGIPFLNAGATIDGSNQNCIYLNEIEITPTTTNYKIRNILETKLQPVIEIFPASASKVAV